MTTQVGLISDTHGLLRPAAIAALTGVDMILHAGDIGKPEVLEQLRAIAPIVAVRGNVDTAAWAETIPEREWLTIEGVTLHLLHQQAAFEPTQQPADLRAVIYGHSHQPAIAERDGILFINPGSAGPRRFKLPISVGRLHIHQGALQAELMELSA